VPSFRDMYVVKNLSGAAEQLSLNQHLASRSYINGYSPSEADCQAYESLKQPPSAADMPHLLRWYRHIGAFAADSRKKWKKDSGASTSSASAVNVNGGAEDDDDDIDLFGSDEEEADEEKERIKQERLKAYAEKKSKKPGPVAKSSILLDVKPWDDETDLGKLETLVRGIETDGLIWGASRLMPVAFGIKKLQIGCVVEDDKVGTDFLEERIQEFEEFVQSVDIAAFNKI